MHSNPNLERGSDGVCVFIRVSYCKYRGESRKIEFPCRHRRFLSQSLHRKIARKAGVGRFRTVSPQIQHQNQPNYLSCLLYSIQQHRRSERPVKSCIWWRKNVLKCQKTDLILKCRYDRTKKAKPHVF